MLECFSPLDYLSQGLNFPPAQLSLLVYHSLGAQASRLMNLSHLV
jgi:hypothetical protein